MAWFDLASGDGTTPYHRVSPRVASEDPSAGPGLGRIFCTPDPTGKNFHFMSDRLSAASGGGGGGKGEVVWRGACEVFVDPSFSVFYAQYMWTVPPSE
ncbi:hypothetical protein IMY05_004G0126400 [Salix suchowensis]|nr:hypothetical protein IMY05_004G0126400 [Salix suchowensis]